MEQEVDGLHVARVEPCGLAGLPVGRGLLASLQVTLPEHVGVEVHEDVPSLIEPRNRQPKLFPSIPNPPIPGPFGHQLDCAIDLVSSNNHEEDPSPPKGGVACFGESAVRVCYTSHPRR